MKTSEEKLNEALRAALKRKFDSFEAVPDPSIFAKVKAQTVNKRYWRYFLLTGLILAGFLTGTVIVSDSDVVVSPGKNIAITHKTGLLPKTNVIKNAKNDFDSDQSKTVKSRIAGIAIKPDNAPVNLNKTAKTVSGNLKNKKDEDDKRETRSVDNNALTNTWVKSKTLKDDLPEISGIPKRNLVEYVQNSSDEVKEHQIVDGADINAEPHVLELNLSELQTHRPFLKSNGMDLPGILLTKQSSSSVLPGTSSGKTNWIFNVAPLQTYQIITVPSSGSRYQNFRFPSALSVKSLGYKFGFGVEKKGVQLLLNYSGFRQFYTYEIAGSDYLVESTGTKNYNVIRKGEKVHEDKKINLLGIGVNKTFKWGNNATGKYYFVTGLEYSHSLNSGQDIGWINAGFGKQFVAGQNMLINLGPYAEFSPLKTSGAGDPFFYQPYRVGFSLGLKFGKP